MATGTIHSDGTVQEISLTANSTNVNSIGASTRAYRIGRMVFVTIYCQISANVAAGADLISGLPAPQGSASVYFPMATNSGNYAYRAKISPSGVVQTEGSAFSSSQSWYVGNVTYVAST